MIRRVRIALPFRVSSLHLCSEGNWIGGSLVDWVLGYCMETVLQNRTRSHRGSQQECLDKLAKFGIPIEVFPLTKVGSLRRERHKGWLESRKIIERQLATKDKNSSNIDEENPSEGVFLAPSQSDILLGRGKASQTHIGNLRLRLMMESNMDRFEAMSTKRGDKMQLAMEMVDRVKSSGGHFLKTQNGMWTIVSEDEACKKVAHDFRTLRKKPKESNGGKDGDRYDDGRQEEHAGVGNKRPNSR
jgi:hypothetical protein